MKTLVLPNYTVRPMYDLNTLNQYRIRHTSYHVNVQRQKLEGPNTSHGTCKIL
jgi:hypothetical protein